MFLQLAYPTVNSYRFPDQLRETRLVFQAHHLVTAYNTLLTKSYKWLHTSVLKNSQGCLLSLSTHYILTILHWTAAAFQLQRRVLVYNTDREWEVRKDIHARNVQWTITDTSLSRDQNFLVYASITPTVHMARSNIFCSVLCLFKIQLGDS